MQNRRKTFDGQPIYLLGERACGVRGYNNIQDFYAIRKQCRDSGTLFIDPEFPITGRYVRPNHICQNPQFLVSKTSKFDVQQERLSDYWFLSAVANLALNEKLFNRVVCYDNSFDRDYAGIFHFRFWQYAKWVDVVVDDRLPANGNELINLHSTERNEFWLALLEKAYAKLYGSYEALYAGISCEAFEDFTGGVSEIYNLKSAPGNLFELMERAINKHNMMTCVENKIQDVADHGLIQIHAYSITEVKSIEIQYKEDKFQLLRMRSQWNNYTDWIEALTDNSEDLCQLPENEKRQLAIKNDDEFWISYQKFLKHFDRLDMCILSPSSLELHADSIKWDLSLIEGQWMKDFSAGGYDIRNETFHLNPQYLLTLKNPDDDAEAFIPVTLTLIQKNRRTREATPTQFLVIGFKVYRVSELQLQEKPLKKEFFETTPHINASKYSNSRRVTKLYNFTAGNYIIVPSAFDPNEEGEFVLRVHSDTKHSLTVFDKDVEIKKVKPKDIEAQKIENLFNDGVNARQEVGWAELKIILDKTIPEGDSEGFSRENCRSLVAMMDVNFTRKVKLEEFKKFCNYYELLMSAFKTFDNDGNQKLTPLEFRDALESVGYSFGARMVYLLIYQYGNEFNEVSYENFIMCAVKIKSLIDVFDKKAEKQASFTLEDWILATLNS